MADLSDFGGFSTICFHHSKCKTVKAYQWKIKKEITNQ
jgi:hypothetical protein